MRTTLAIALALLMAGVLRADKVVMNDGRTYEGVVLEETDTQVKIKTAKATITLPKDQVKEILKTGGGSLAEREKKLAELKPLNPQGYLDVAIWLGGPGKDAFDDQIFIHLCNYAAGLDRKLACDANVMLGKYYLEKSNRGAAARAFARALNADPTNREAKSRAADLKKDLEDASKREMSEIEDAMNMIIGGNYVDGLPKLRKCKGNDFAGQAATYMGKSIDQLVDDLQSRVCCKPCGGTGKINCPACNGSGLIKCSVCGGTGKKKGFVSGKGSVGLADAICRTCTGLGDVLCTGCHAERKVTIQFIGSDGVSVSGPLTVTVDTAAGKEKEELRKEVDLVGYKKVDGGFPVYSITADSISTGGTKNCPTCKGIKFNPPTDPVNVEPLTAYRDALDDRVNGRVPLEAAATGSELADPALMDAKEFYYRGGKWSDSE